MATKANKLGSSFDSFLEDEGLLEEVSAAAMKRVIAWQLSQAMKAKGLSKLAMAKRICAQRLFAVRATMPSRITMHGNKISAAVYSGTFTPNTSNNSPVSGGPSARPAQLPEL